MTHFYVDKFFVIGITEEMMFRELILKEINRMMSFWKANVITSLLFLLIHYPD
ncbi:CPBP family intramembrane glutamic endopeptidase [Neobacillus massiliamazoniensis]|uniref:CPBP family glutamic-type intramembrane protease n=1 Tax=Neobacillus massiliamazoniensis TaxID=1499688 RepID=UPI000A739B7B